MFYLKFIYIYVYLINLETYRYLISAKVLDQLEEFEILPCIYYIK